MKSYAAMLSVILLAGVAAGCDGDDPPPPPPPGDAGRRDGGTPVDGGPLPDGGDAGTDQDGAVTFPDGGGPGDGCAFTRADDLFNLSIDIEERARLVRAAGGPSGWGVVWADRHDGFPHVRGAIVPSSGPPSGVTAVDITDDASIILDPGIAYAGGDWLASYASNAAGSFDAYVVDTDGSLTPSGAATQLTTTAGVREDSTSVIAAGDGYLVTWVRDDMTAGSREVYAQALGADFSPSGTAQVVASGSAMTTVPDLAAVDGGAALVLARGTAGGGELVLQMLNANGTESGSETVIIDTGVEGTVAVAGGSGGGAVAFGLIVGGARNEVRFRAFDGDGALTGGTRVIVGSPDEGRDASITPFAGGYAVAYRKLLSVTEAMIVVAFLDLGGEIVEQMELTTASATGGRTSIAVSGDGHLLVSWAQVGLGMSQISAARIRCD